MLGRMLLSMCVLLLCTSLVYADAASVGKVRDLIVLSEDPAYACVDAGATLVFQPDKDNPLVGNIEVSVVIKNFLPNTPYFVTFTQFAPGGVIETNPAGNGSFKGSNPGTGNPMDPPGGQDVFLEVYLADENGLPVGEVIAFGVIE